MFCPSWCLLLTLIIGVISTAADARRAVLPAVGTSPAAASASPSPAATAGASLSPAAAAGVSPSPATAAAPSSHASPAIDISSSLGARP
jgi:hypothetical protein